MAETEKKTKTAAKPRKAAQKKNAAPVAMQSVTSINRSVSHEDVARLAHRYYQERGQKNGHHIEDWFRAEQELIGKAS